MPHPKLLTDLEISQLVKDRTKNSTPFRVLGSIFKIAPSTAYNYWRKYGKDTTTNGMSEWEDTCNFYAIYEEKTDVEPLPWKEVQSLFEPPKTQEISNRPIDKYLGNDNEVSQSHSDLRKEKKSEVATNTSPYELTPSSVFSNLLGRRR